MTAKKKNMLLICLSFYPEDIETWNIVALDSESITISRHLGICIPHDGRLRWFTLPVR